MPEIRSVRSLLRATTAPDHDRVDTAFAGFDLADPDGYRRFLIAQAGPVAAVEAAIDACGPLALVPDWPERRRAGLIAEDLADLGSAMPAADPFALAGEAAMLGALYVLEGSRLGGSVLARNIPMELPARFMRCPPAPNRWRALIATLEQALVTRDRIDIATGAARAVFDRFERSAREYGRTPVVE